jgi:trehalose/maltose hydrolase-like predicted phosphorylase
LLGDGSLEKSLKSKNARFKFSQTIKAKDYFLQLYSIFKPFFTPNYSFANYNYLDKRTGNSYTTLSFTTRALPLCPTARILQSILL